MNARARIKKRFLKVFGLDKVGMMYHSESFLKLKELTNRLIDRDAVRVKDIELFRHLLEHSPIKICLWEFENRI